MRCDLPELTECQGQNTNLTVEVLSNLLFFFHYVSQTIPFIFELIFQKVQA